MAEEGSQSNCASFLRTGSGDVDSSSSWKRRPMRPHPDSLAVRILLASNQGDTSLHTNVRGAQREAGLPIMDLEGSG